jgi:hypothetical protein
MVVLIVAIVMVASIIKAKYGHHHGRRRDRLEGASGVAVDSVETARMREELKVLRDRLAVLERITIEKESSLEREIEQLRDRT